MNTARLLALVFLIGCGPEEGPPGPVGDPGPAGPSGVGLTKRTSCNGDGAIGGASFSAVHLRYDFADGSAFITCHVEPANTNLPRRDSYPHFYFVGDANIETGNCIVRLDLDSPSGDGFGTFLFNAPKNAPRATTTYEDLTSPHSGITFDLPCVTSDGTD